ncbi:MAG TPA: DUF3368 domain-containing protein [Longimicrobium sp.]|jgi:hypothetical protein|uniref:DUF3368 domain-containing protein n=1 Tax=Longimicrobium sp. TaxID=2029185 RepID=UPI002ED9E54F
MLVVADTSALVALAACNGLGLLDALFDQVRVPRAVWGECSVEGKPFAAQLAEYLRARVVDVTPAENPVGASALGRGEIEAMALYRSLGADRLLVDDDRARRVARLNGLNVVGSIGILLGAKAEGMVTSIKPYLEQVQSAGVHLGKGLLDEALRLAGEA